MPWARNWASATRRVPLRCGPPTGVWDDPATMDASDPGLMLDMLNVQPYYGNGAPGVVQRTLFLSLGTLSAGSRVQGLGSHTSKAGTSRFFAVCNGKLYRLTWAGGSVPATVTDVTPVAGVTIDASAAFVWLQPFGDELIVSDGVNKPWRATNLGATPVTGTVINVDSVPTAWAAYGPPTVYYAKVFFVRDDDRTRMVWSAEGDASVGYEQASYSNFWSLRQTSQEPITRLLGRNDALYVFRSSSIGAVYGAADSTFSTAGTHDAISMGVGTVKPASVVDRGGSVFFIDTNGKPHKIEGGQVIPMWQAMSREVSTGPSASNDPYGFALYYPPLDLTLMGEFTRSAGGSTSGYSDTMLPFFADRWYGRWTIGRDTTANLVNGAVFTGWPVTEQQLVVGDKDGRLWQYLTPNVGGSDTDPGSAYPASVVPNCTVTTRRLSADHDGELHFQRVSVDASAGVLGITSMVTSARVDYQTSRATFGSAQTVTNTVVPADTPARLVAGINTTARYLSVRLRDSTAATAPFYVGEIRVDSTSAGQSVTAP